MIPMPMQPPPMIPQQQPMPQPGMPPQGMPQPQQMGQPPSMFNGQIPPQLMQMLMQQMQRQQTMQQNPNPLASVISNPGGAMGPQTMQGQGDQNGSAGGGNGMGGLMQIINAMKSQQSVNGTEPQGGPDIMKLLAMMKGQ